jgi:hypothetical protein
MKMASRKPKTFLCLAAAVTLAVGVGCARSQVPEGTKAGPDSKPTVDSELSLDSNDPLYLSDRAADRGEELLLPETFDKALEAFNLALKHNPQNSRARFWIVYLKIQLELKGTMTRIAPLYDKLPDGKNRYQRMVDGALQSQSESLRQFYLQGPRDITNEAQFQEWLDRMLLRLTEAREEFHSLKTGREFSIKVPKSNLELGTTTNSRARCAGKFGPIFYQAAECDAESYEIYLNRADLEVLSYSLAQLQAQLSLLNAYRLDKNAASRVADGRSDNTGAAWFAEWINSGEASLRSKDGVESARLALRDLGVAMKWLNSNQKSVCPRGRLSPKNRPGYLFAFGVCTEAFAGKTAKEEWIAGTLEALISNTNVSSKQLKDDAANYEIDLKKFFSEPPTSLSNLAKASIRCDRLSTINESALRPYFVQGSANELLGLTTKYCPDPEVSP